MLCNEQLAGLATYEALKGDLQLVQELTFIRILTFFVQGGGWGMGDGGCCSVISIEIHQTLIAMQLIKDCLSLTKDNPFLLISDC